MDVGDLLLFDPDEPYELRIDNEINPMGERLVESGDYHIFFNGSWVDEWWKRHKRPTRMVKVELTESLLVLFRQLVLEQRRISNPYPEISSYYMRILCLEVDRLLAEHPTITNTNYVAYEIKNYIEENASSCSSSMMWQHILVSVFHGGFISSKKRLAKASCNTRLTYG